MNVWHENNQGRLRTYCLLRSFLNRASALSSLIHVHPWIQHTFRAQFNLTRSLLFADFLNPFASRFTFPDEVVWCNQLKCGWQSSIRYFFVIISTRNVTASFHQGEFSSLLIWFLIIIKLTQFSIHSLFAFSCVIKIIFRWLARSAGKYWQQINFWNSGSAFKNTHTYNRVFFPTLWNILAVFFHHFFQGKDIRINLILSIIYY